MMRERLLHFSFTPIWRGSTAATRAFLLSAGMAALGQDATPIDPAAPPPVLKPGQFTWTPERSTVGPVVVVVSLPEQRAYVYRNGIRIGRSTVSTGRAGHATPTGVFTILQKNVDHRSNLYNNAPMPYMQRLTWDGIALHAGKLPGYPASHGCIRLPYDFSKLLFSVTSRQTTVVIADQSSAPKEIVHPGLILANSLVGKTADTPVAPIAGGFTWTPEASPTGPVSILASGADKVVYVYRNGVLIGRANMTIRNPEQPLKSAVYVVLEGKSSTPSPHVPGRPMLRWMTVSLTSDKTTSSQEGLVDTNRVTLPSEFAGSVYDSLVPGTTLMVTDQPATTETTTSPDFTVMISDASPSKAAPRR